MTCFVPQLCKSVCISASCELSDSYILSPFYINGSLTPSPNLPGVLEGGPFESWEDLSRGAVCLMGLQRLGSSGCRSGGETATMSERPPFVSPLLVPAQSLSPMTKINRISEKMESNQCGLVGWAWSIVLKLPLWVRADRGILAHLSSSLVKAYHRLCDITHPPAPRPGPEPSPASDDVCLEWGTFSLRANTA